MAIMSVKTIAPPQTYSRLFRPWDAAAEGIRDNSPSKASDSGSDRTAIKSEPCEATIRARLDLDSPMSSEPKSPMYSPAKHSLIGTPELDTAAAFLNHPTDLASYYYYCSQQQQKLGVELLPAGFNFAGLPVDPLTYDQMEQEYFRVLSEDAKAKLLSSRKQRPKKFKCPHCDVAFSNNGQLKGHIRIHTGKLPHTNSTSFLVTNPSFLSFNSYRRAPVQVRRTDLRQDLYPERGADPPQAHPHRNPAVRVPNLRKEVWPPRSPQEAHQDAHAPGAVHVRTCAGSDADADVRSGGGGRGRCDATLWVLSGRERGSIK